MLKIDISCVQFLKYFVYLLKETMAISARLGWVLSFFWAGIEPVKIKYEYLDEKKNFQKQIWLIFYVVYKEYLTL